MIITTNIGLNSKIYWKGIDKALLLWQYFRRCQEKNVKTLLPAAQP